MDSETDRWIQAKTIVLQRSHALYKDSVAIGAVMVPSTNFNLFFERRAILIARAHV